MDTATVIIAALAALGAVGAAIGSFASAKATRRAAEAQLESLRAAQRSQEGVLLKQFLDQYSQWRMSESLRLLRNWDEEKGTESAKAWKRALDSADETALEVDKARRRVSHFFQKAVCLYKADYASRDFLAEIAKLQGVDPLGSVHL